MQRDDLSKMIAEIYVYFRFKEMPPERAVDAWFEDLSYIKFFAADYITKKICDLDNIPRNLPKTIKYYYEQYKRDYPESVTYGKCDDCFNHGYFIIRKWLPDYKYHGEFLVKCGACNNLYKQINTKDGYIGKTKLAVATLQELKDKGFNIITLPDYSQPLVRGNLEEEIEPNLPFRDKEEDLGDNKNFNEDEIPF